MESWNFSSESKAMFFSDETVSSSSMALGLSEILCSNMISPNSSSLSLVDEESGSRISSSLMESNNQESSLIALKLGSQTTTADQTQISSSSSSSSLKRARTRGCYSQATPFCQVLGCNLDLSDSKDYHKKHKVCDVHSKTSIVVVNGVEQRFCQQCSRFHLLNEFDDGKRSCRRRLAGHNERRRKPQFDKSHKFSHPYQGNGYLGTVMQKRTPFVFSDILSGVVVSPENYKQVDSFGQHKYEEKTIYANSHLSSPPTTNTQLLHNSFVQSEEDYYSNPASSFYKSLGVPSSPRALSLLSSQSQNLSHQTAPQLSDKPLRPRQVEPTGFYPNMGIELLEPSIFPEVNSHVTSADDFEFVSDSRAFQGSNYLHSRYHLAPENGSTVDLLQLSSHLQRVENQRFIQVKQENDDFCCFPTA